MILRVRCTLALAVGAAAVLVAQPAADVREIRVLSAVGMRQVLAELGPRFERASGHVLTITFDASGVIHKRIEAGEVPDVVMVNRQAIDRLIESGKVLKDTVVDLATSRVAVAVRRGAAQPDVSTPEAFKAAMLAAQSIAYPDPRLGGSSGVHVANIFERLGIAETLRTRIVYADPPAPGSATPGSLVAEGKAQIALHQLQELMAVPGVAVVGPVPDALQETFVFSAAVVRGASDEKAARALIDFLSTAESRASIEGKGMGLPRAAQDVMVVERGRVGNVALGASADSVYKAFRDRAKLVDLKLEGHLSPALEIKRFGAQLTPSIVAEIGAGERQLVVSRIWVFDTALRTKDGIGVGSTFAELRSHYTVNWVGSGEGSFFARVESLGISFQLDASQHPELWRMRDPKAVPNDVKVVAMMLTTR